MKIEFRDPSSLNRLLVAQFLTVFNDNAFKQVVLLAAVASSGSGDPQARAGLIFALPFLLLAGLAGDLADRFSKRTMFLLAKVAEAAIFLGAAVLLPGAGPGAALIVLGLIGMQSAILGPAKYGLLPEIAPGKELTAANGRMQASVTAGILLGTGSAGVLYSVWQSNPTFVPALLGVVALLGTWVARGIHPQPAADPRRRLRPFSWRPLWRGFQEAGKIRGLRGILLGHALFWLVGALGLFAWNEAGMHQLQVSTGWWTAGLASLSIALALGCLLAGRSHGKEDAAKQVRWGGLGMCVAFVAVSFLPAIPWLVWLLSMLGNFCMGFYLVPLKVRIQGAPPPALAGRILASSQALDWVFILGASLLKETLGRFGLHGTEIFAVMGVAILPAALSLPASTRKLASMGESA